MWVMTNTLTYLTMTQKSVGGHGSQLNWQKWFTLFQHLVASVRVAAPEYVAVIARKSQLQGLMDCLLLLEMVCAK